LEDRKALQSIKDDTEILLVQALMVVSPHRDAEAAPTNFLEKVFTLCQSRLDELALATRGRHQTVSTPDQLQVEGCKLQELHAAYTRLWIEVERVSIPGPSWLELERFLNNRVEIFSNEASMAPPFQEKTDCILAEDSLLVFSHLPSLCLLVEEAGSRSFPSSKLLETLLRVVGCAATALKRSKHTPSEGVVRVAETATAAVLRAIGANVCICAHVSCNFVFCDGC